MRNIRKKQLTNSGKFKKTYSVPAKRNEFLYSLTTHGRHKILS